jgi:hypothetical protein
MEATMIIRSSIDSECQGRMYYTYKSMGKEYKEYLPKYRTRLSEYNTEQLIEDLKKDPNVKDIYIYKVNYSDGRISLLANPNYPIGKLSCEDDD